LSLAATGSPPLSNCYIHRYQNATFEETFLKIFLACRNPDKEADLDVCSVPVSYSLGDSNWNYRNQNHYHRNHRNNRRLVWPEHVIKDKNGKGSNPRTRCEGGHNDLVEGQGEGKQASGKKG
jgi:hypothetical protein